MNPARAINFVLVAGKLNQINTLKDENDSLKCQVEAYKNEVEMIKSDKQDRSDGSKQEVKSLQMALQGMQQVNLIFNDIVMLKFRV